MTDVISTTNPIPPTGMTNTNVPLGITSSVSETPQPVNVPILPTSVYESSHGIYLGNFPFTDANAIGTKLYTWDYRKPLTAGYARTVSATGQYSPFTPWDLILPSFSKQCKIEYDILLIPVKIGDCRARLDCVFKFDNSPFNDLYSTNLLANYNQHFFLDDCDEQIRFSVPTYWVSNNVSTDIVKTKTRNASVISDIELPSAFLPSTKLNLYVSSPYQHNSMQLSTFNVHVVLFPKPTAMLGLAGKRTTTVTRQTVGTRTDLLKPYFYNTS